MSLFTTFSFPIEKAGKTTARVWGGRAGSRSSFTQRTSQGSGGSAYYIQSGKRVVELSRFVAGPIGERKRLTVVLHISQASFSPPLTQRPRESLRYCRARDRRVAAASGVVLSRLTVASCCALRCVPAVVGRRNKR